MPRTPPETDARGAAFAILQRVAAGPGQAAALLARLPPRMPARDRALATTIVNGVLRRRADLDRAIARVASRPPAEIDPPVLEALRIALYQVLFLDRVPAPAAVDGSVALVRRRCGRQAAAFANGVLRNCCRRIVAGDRQAVLAIDSGLAEDRRLAETHSFPPFLAARFLARYGPGDAAALMEAMNRPAPVVLRATPRAGGIGVLRERLARDGIRSVPSPILPGEALRVEAGAPQSCRAFRDGLFYIQDEASQIVAHLAEPIGPGDRIVDLCAAPGGKILTIADRLSGPPPALLIAADRTRSRLRLLEQNLRRTGTPGIRLLVTDAARPGLRPAGFARVILDAPCSGTGIIRRHPEIRWRRGETEIAGFAARQATALEAAADLVAPGGRIVYSVCSLEPEEGPERTAALMAARPGLGVVDARAVLPAGLHHLVDARGFLLTLPHRDDIDGFFAAVLEAA
jgi:16S rRNA (cytosine967-C5)-methyltransferase